MGKHAHVILPLHREIDKVREAGKGAIGTTKRGIGPAYEAKMARRGVRMSDLCDEKRFRALYEHNLEEVGDWLRARGGEIQPTEDVVTEYMGYAERLRGYVSDASRLVYDEIKRGRHVLFEGAQGCLLDLDHGTYPYVTSSSTIAAGACQSAGIGPTAIDAVVGITKAYATRVGAGPFPTELHGEAGERLRKAGGEYGATTGRPRRCGWLDLPALRMGARLSGMTSLALTKLDVLAGLREVSVCVAYRVDGKELDEPPIDPDDIARAEPVFTGFSGWGTLPPDARDVRDLPGPARAYVEAIERMAGVSFCLVSVGPDRNETIRLHDPFGPAS